MADADAAAVSFSVLEETKVSRAQHGLRHGDYGRYRAYCARRLTRLHRSTGHRHAEKKKFVAPPPITPAAVQADARLLLVPLVNAERAWSYAMELKGEVERVPRKRHHLRTRLAKAAKHAAELAALCAAAGTARTALEAEAYASWLNGSLRLEREDDFDAALAAFGRAKAAYERLSSLGTVEEAATCRERIAELEPSMRYCAYKRGGAAAADTSDLGDEALQSKLDAMLEEEQGRQAQSDADVVWRGRPVPLRSTKVRGLLLAAEAHVAQLATSASMSLDRRLTVYDRAFMALSDARQQLRDDLASLRSGRDSTAADALVTDLRTCEATVSEMHLTYTVARNRLLVDTARARLERREKGDKPVRPTDVVRLFDTLASSVVELGEAVQDAARQGEGDREAADALALQCRADERTCKAGRAFYLARAYSAAERPAEACLLFGRAAEHAEEALSLWGPVAGGEAAEAAKERGEAEARQLFAEGRAQKVVLHAQALAAEEAEGERVRGGGAVAGLSLEDEDGAKGGRRRAPTLLEAPNVYAPALNSKSDGRFVRVPPPLAPIACQPIVLDNALNEVEFPSNLAERAGSSAPKQQAAGPVGGFASRLFGWTRGGS